MEGTEIEENMLRGVTNDSTLNSGLPSCIGESSRRVGSASLLEVLSSSRMARLDSVGDACCLRLSGQLELLAK